MKKISELLNSKSLSLSEDKDNINHEFEENELKLDKIDTKEEEAEIYQNELKKNGSEIEEKNKEEVDISVIIPCKNEISTLKFTVDSIMNSKNFSSFEIIIVDDGSIDSSTQFLKEEKEIYKDVVLINTNKVGAAEARNKGAEVAKGKYLFFCDAHIKAEDYWLDNLVSVMLKGKGDLVAPAIADMEDENSVGYGQSLNDEFKVIWLEDQPEDIREIPIACGCCFGITKKAFEKINGFDHIFQVWGKEDEEICLKAWLYGYKVVINPNVTVRHLFRKKHPYKVTSVNVIYNTLCFAYSHFNKDRILRTINTVKGDWGYVTAVEQVKNNIDEIFKQRAKYIKERKYDDNFFFQKFIIPF